MGFIIKPTAGSALARPKTFLNIVVDASSSMAPFHQQTLEAFNTFLRSQQGNRVDEVFVTFTSFTSKVQVRYTAKPLAEVQPLTARDYYPDGDTALYDGVYKTLIEMDKRVHSGHRVLTVILTDGADTCSREISGDGLRRVIEQYQARGNWTFVYLGAHPHLASAQTVAAQLGVRAGNAQHYNASGAGVSEALAKVDDAVSAYRSGDSLQTDTFWQGEAKKHKRPNWSQ